MSNIHYLNIEPKQDETARKREDLIFCMEYLENEARKAGMVEVSYLLSLAQISARELDNKSHENKNSEQENPTGKTAV